MEGIAVLRFDFTGLGDSEGDFTDTTFTSNVDDIVAAADYLKKNYEPARILIGHSLGGAAVIFAAGRISSVRAITTIGAPSQPEHVLHLLEENLEDIERKGIGTFSLAGRKFTVKKQLIDDLQQKNMFPILKNLREAILVMHSPQDQTVQIENAAEIYHAAHHPKSFVTLDHADHMLTNKFDAFYAGTMIGTWAIRYLNQDKGKGLKTSHSVVARSGETGLTTEILAGRHSLQADASERLGGNDFGPSPYEFLCSSLAASIAMNIQSYFEHHHLDGVRAMVHIRFKERFEDSLIPDEGKSSLRELIVIIEIDRKLNSAEKQHVIEAAKNCTIYDLLKNQIDIQIQLNS